LIETEFTAPDLDLDLTLDLKDHGEIVGVAEYVPAVLEHRQQVQGLVEVDNDNPGRLVSRRLHTPERSVER
jgi:hypothetical protein